VSTLSFDDLAKDGTTDASVSGTIAATHASSLVTISALATPNVADAKIDTLTITGAGDVDMNDADMGANGAEINIIDATGLTGYLYLDGGDFTDATVVRLGNAASGHTNVVETGSGADVFTGGSGIDNITSGSGADTITAGGGADNIFPGEGLDTIVLTETTSAADTVFVTNGGSSHVDTVSGFTAGTDKIGFNIGTDVFQSLTLANLDNTTMGSGTASVNSYTTNSTDTDNGTILFIDNTTQSSFVNAIGTAAAAYADAGTTPGGAKLSFGMMPQTLRQFTVTCQLTTFLMHLHSMRSSESTWLLLISQQQTSETPSRPTEFLLLDLLEITS